MDEDEYEMCCSCDKFARIGSLIKIKATTFGGNIVKICKKCKREADERSEDE